MLSRVIQQINYRSTSVLNTLAVMQKNEKEQYLQKLEENAKVTYKKYPHLPHQDPSSPEYIHSELDEYHDEVEVKAYNTVIDNFKIDLKVQR